VRTGREVEVTGCMTRKVLADPAIDTPAIVDDNKSNGLPVSGSWGFQNPPPAYEKMLTENSKSWLRVSENRIIIILVPQKARNVLTS